MQLAQNLDTIQQKAGITLPKDIGGVISKILPYIFGISGILLLLFLLFGGLQLMFSAGDPKKTQSAQGKITNALVGFIIVFLAYWLTQLVGTILNIQIIKDIFK
jgi:hypothetical protein